jgi:hypothetical protein
VDVYDESDGTLAEVTLASSASGAVVLAWKHSVPDPVTPDPQDLLDTVQARVLAGAGSDWGDAADVSVSSHLISNLRAGVDGGGVATVTWTRFDEGTSTGTVEGSTRSPSGDWSAADDLSAPGVDAGGQELCVATSGAATAVWLRSVDLVLETSRRPAGGEWSDPQDLTAGPAQPFEWDVDSDAAGNVVAAWSAGDDNGPLEVRGTGFDATPPAVSGLTIPTAGTVGQALAFGMMAVDVWSPYAATWSFGDGTVAMGPATTHAYAAPGAYQVSVTATDAVGNSTTRSGTVTVAAAAPPPPPPLAKPVLSALALTTKTIHVVGSRKHPRATRLRLVLRTDAQVTVRLKRTRPVGGKALKARLVRSLGAGKASIRLRSKVAGKRLLPGTYVVIVTARNSAGTSAARKVRLTIKP